MFDFFDSINDIILILKRTPGLLVCNYRTKNREQWDSSTSHLLVVVFGFHHPHKSFFALIQQQQQQQPQTSIPIAAQAKNARNDDSNINIKQNNIISIQEG
jgi:hypothetical protein